MLIRHISHKTVAILAIAVLLSCSTFVSSSWGEEARSNSRNQATSQNAPPEPEDEIFDTADGVRLHATFYPGIREKESVPVILVHDLKSSRKGFHDLAVFLQARGCAVLVPDLRGHGESIRAEGVRNAINPDRMNSRQFQAISGPRGDMEACKKFLMRKNNQGELNIEKLCIVGAGFGAIVAADWSALDWSWPPLATGKQGQDVKALVLISPAWSSRGLQMKPATTSQAFRSIFSTMILVGEEDRKSRQCADRLAKIIERFNPNAKSEDLQTRSFFYLKLDTSLKGMKMLEEASLQLPQRIAKFIDLRLINQPFPWKERKKAF